MIDRAVLDWLLDATSDPAIRWQALRDLADEPPEVWQAERARVATEGWGAQLLALADDDGQWAGGAFMPADYVWGGDEQGQPWTATCWALAQLREFGIEPATMRDHVALIGEHSTWDHDGQPYWDGEVEPCINGRTVSDGVYFGVDVDPIVELLVTDRLGDGGWNCDAENGSTVSSFDSTISVVEGLLDHEQATGGTAASREARAAGEEYLLARSLHRSLRTGEAHEKYLRFIHPNRWRYDVLRGLDHFRAASVLTGQAPDERLAEAIAYVRSRQRDDGRWECDRVLNGRRWFDVDAEQGLPSRWVTLRALRVLQWWDARA